MTNDLRILRLAEVRLVQQAEELRAEYEAKAIGVQKFLTPKFRAAQQRIREQLDVIRGRISDLEEPIVIAELENAGHGDDNHGHGDGHRTTA